MKELPLASKGYVALVDDSDYDELAKYRWFAAKTKTGVVYATRFIGTRGPRVSMHRQILGLTRADAVEVDHADHNGLNNTRENLRIATTQQNQGNRKKETLRPTSSRYKGVTWNKCARKWQAQVSVDCLSRYLGVFEKEEDAAKAYDAAARAVFGEFACPNFPEAAT